MKAKFAVLAIAAAVVAMMATSASALDFTGYFRSGLGFDSKGGGQACFQLPGMDFKSRLGNECDTYLEVGFGQTLYKADDGTEFYYQFMPGWGIVLNQALPSTVSPTGGYYGYGTGSLYVQQNWGSVKFTNGATLWAGWRYFQRHNIDNLDWFWWNPAQGNGAVGIENVKLGDFGKLALTLVRLDVNYAVGATSTAGLPDLRLVIPFGDGGSSLEVGFALAIVGGSSHGGNVPTYSPWATLLLTTDPVAGGNNFIAFQYASGAIYQMGGSFAYPPSGTGAGTTVGGTQSMQWRILDQFVYHPIPDFSGELAVVYQDKKQDDQNEAGFLTIQLRPAWHLNDLFKIAADIAYQSEMSIKIAGATVSSDPNLWKFSLVPTIVAGAKNGLWARPEIRAFVTYATWSNLLPGTSVANGVFGDKTNGLSWGAQMEAWW